MGKVRFGYGAERRSAPQAVDRFDSGGVNVRAESHDDEAALTANVIELATIEAFLSQIAALVCRLSRPFDAALQSNRSVLDCIRGANRNL
jgi:hypothetical protein